MVEWAVGVDLGGTNVRAAGVDLRGRVHTIFSEPVDWAAAPERPFAQVVRLVTQVIDAHGSEPPVGVGIGATGPLDVAAGTIDNQHTLPPSMRGDVVGLIHGTFGLPVLLENDADVAALAEQQARRVEGRRDQSLACITVGTGIGVGLVHDGLIYRGADATHPEAGHMVVDPLGPQCYCGAHGCAESLASASAIVSLGRSAGVIAEGGDARDVYASATAGDVRARAIVRGAQDALGLLARNLVATVAPRCIVLAGNALGSPRELLKNVTAQVGTYPFGPKGGVTVSISSLDGASGCVGAALLAFPR